MARRRANGEGTITRRKDGRYEARIYVPIAGGGSKRITLYARTQAEVREKLLDQQQDVRHGKQVPGKSQRLEEFLDYWLEEVIRPNKKPSTHAEYSWMTENILNPGLGSYTLDQLSVAEFQTWLNAIYRAGKFISPNGKTRKVSVDRITRLRKILSSALSRAVREGLLPRNIAENVDVPSYQPKERTPWSADEARRFLAGAVDHELYPAWLILIVYGLRRGEVLGLRWGDVDFERGVVRIRNTLQRGGGAFRQGSPKTAASIRDLALLAPVRKAMLDLAVGAGALQQPPSPDSLVFVTKLGQPRDPDAFRTSFKRAARRIGVPEITVHDARHTAATLLKDAGVPDRDVQLILGHANITTTLQIYQHGNLGKQRAALEQVAATLVPTAVDSASESAAATGVNCRQLSSDPRLIGTMSTALLAASTSVAKWYTWQDSNLRPLAPQLETASLGKRLREVERAVIVHRRVWLFGAAVVIIAVSDPATSADR